MDLKALGLPPCHVQHAGEAGATARHRDHGGTLSPTCGKSASGEEQPNSPKMQVQGSKRGVGSLQRWSNEPQVSVILDGAPCIHPICEEL